MKKRYIALIVIAAIILALGGCTYTGYHMIFGSPVKTTNIEDYDKKNDQRIKSNLMIFPQYIAETATDVKYYYYYQDMIMDPMCQIYLHCKYSEEDYNKELERLQEIRERYQKKDENGGYTSSNFNGDVYIHEYDKTTYTEYAIADSNTHEIVYIYLQFISEKKVKFDKKYLPLDYTENSQGK